jgi:hypothetical protein
VVCWEPWDRGVKNRLNLRGVTEGFLLSFRPFDGFGGERVDVVSDMATVWEKPEESVPSMRFEADILQSLGGLGSVVRTS